ncbi:MAG: DHH family phosphoesterase [Bacteroidales bacterium]
MKTEDINRINKLLKDDPHVVILSHANPDGDAIGSVLAMYGYLHKRNVKVEALLPDSIPVYYRWMEHAEAVLSAGKDPELVERRLKEADLLFCFDFNAFARVEALEKPLRNAGGLKVLIDHHPDPEMGFDIQWSDTKLSSTAELLFRFIHALGGEKFIDRYVAEALYVGMMTDTGSFNFNSDHPDMYLVLHQLVSLGVNPALLHQRVYDNFSHQRMRLLGHCLLHKMVVIPEAKTAYISLSLRELQQFDHQKGDTEGLVNYPLSIKGVVFAALFTETGKFIKASFRSKNSFKANVLAKEYFNGGGHKNAAGGKSFVSMKQTIKHFESLVKSKFLNDLKNADDS